MDAPSGLVESKSTLDRQSYLPHKSKNPPRSPLRDGFSVCRLLTLLLGRPKLFHQIDVGSPPALSPSLAGSQRIGGREAADPLTSDDFNLSSTLKALGSAVDQLCGFSIPAAAASTGVVSTASISTGSRSPATAVSNSLP